MRNTALSVIVAISLCTLCAPLAAGESVGWRTDGTGQYPAAKPPTEWAKDGVLWSAPTDQWSNATPVLVDGKIFTCQEPDTLVCVQASDGKPLWQKANTREDALSDEQKAEAKTQAAEFARLDEQLKPLRAEKGKLDRQMRDVHGKLKKDPNDADAKAKAEDLKEQIKQLQDKMGPLEGAQRKVSEYRTPDTHPVNGFTSATPVSDGKRVWVLFGTGMAACYDLDGNRKWLRFLGKTRQGWGHSASPILAGGKLICQINDMVALDGETGDELWHAKADHYWGTPIVVQVAGQDVIVTPKGQFVRAADGKLLASKAANLTFNAPIVQDGVIYFAEKGAIAVKVPTEMADELKLDVLYNTVPKGWQGGGGERYYASPVLAEGLIYLTASNQTMTVLDAKDGSTVYTRKTTLGGTPYPSLAAAGGYVFVSSDSGKTDVIKPGREYQQIAENRLDGFRGCPVFDGGRIYFRTLKGLVCVGK